MNEPTNWQIIAAMKKYGGGFAKALANAAACADETNLNRIKAAFPDFWLDYKKFVAQQTTTFPMPCPNCGGKDLDRVHHDATGATPECWSLFCNNCDHAWAHGMI